MDTRETLDTMTDSLSEFSHHGRDARFADGRIVVALAVVGFVAVAAAAVAVIAVVWR